MFITCNPWVLVACWGLAIFVSMLEANGPEHVQ